MPVAVEKPDDQGIEQLPRALRAIFANAIDAPQARRVVVRGGPDTGTGKSVALRLIVRDAASLPHPDQARRAPGRAAGGGWVPVRLSFADLRDAGFDLVACLPRDGARGRAWGSSAPLGTGTRVQRFFLHVG